MRGSAAAARARASRLPAEQRREHLLDVAAAVVLERGFEALTMEAVKERAGISRGLGYAYFANAEDLAFALHEREVREFDRRVAAATAGARSFEERVRSATRAYFDFVAERGELLAVLQTKLSGPGLRQSMRARLGGFIAYWARQIESELGTSSQLAASLARAAFAASDALARRWRSKRLSRAEAEQLCVDFMLGGLHRTLGWRELPRRMKASRAGTGAVPSTRRRRRATPAAT